MKFIGYIIAYFFLWLIAWLPGKVHYLISDFLYLLIYYIIRYRKKVVWENLRFAFPDYPEKKIRKIARRFYRHFSDFLVESALMPFISDKRSEKNISYRNAEIVERLYNEGKFLIGITAHYGNWEYLVHMEKRFPYKFVAIYKPLKNKYFDRLVKRSRVRYGSIAVAMKQVGRRLIELKNENRLAFCGFLTDQRPVWQHIQYWTIFLDRYTPIYTGPEKIAHRLEAAVIFISIRKIKRGRYELGFDLISENAKEEEPFAITETHVKLLEKLIREEPAYWLWSHRRWKIKYEDFVRDHPDRKVTVHHG